MAEFRLVSSGLLNEQFKDFCLQAELEGRGPATLASAETFIAKLGDDPLSVGEVLYHLPHSDLPVRHSVHSPWSVHFVVDEERRLVYLTKIVLLD